MKSSGFDPEDFYRGLSLIPTLSAADVSEAAKSAAVPVPHLSGASIDLLNEALATYVTERLSLLGIASCSLTIQLKELDHARETARAHEEAAQLRAKAKRLQEYKEKKAKTKDRHEGNPAMDDLVAAWRDLYMQITGKRPSISNNFDTQDGSAFTRLLAEILAAFSAKIPEKLERLDPGLSDSLRCSSQALTARFRRSPLYLPTVLKEAEAQLRRSPRRTRRG